MRVLSAAAALLLLGSAASQDCPSTYTESMPLEDGAINLKYAVVGAMLCVEMTSENPGWVGFAVSPTGRMEDSVAMIGLPDAGTVQKYALKSGSPRITAMPAESQTLMSTAVMQADDGTTTIKFAKLLVEEGEPEILTTGKNTFLYAAGSSNEPGYHAVRSPFSLDFEGVGEGASPGPTPAGSGTDLVPPAIKTIAPTPDMSRGPPTPTPPAPAPSGASAKSMIRTMILGVAATVIWCGL